MNSLTSKTISVISKPTLLVGSALCGSQTPFLTLQYKPLYYASLASTVVPKGNLNTGMAFNVVTKGENNYLKNQKNI